MVRTRLVSMVFILTWGLECLRAQQNETLIEIANMPEKSINHGLQDKAGFIWLASHNGLFRYDGQRFEVFNTSSEPHLNANRIQSIHENNNTIWIGTEKGIDLLNLNTYQVQALNFEEVNVSVVDIQSYADTVWAMNSEGFIYRFENKLLTSKISNPFDTNGTFGSHPRLLYTSGNLLAISENKGCYKISGRQKPIVSKIDLASKESHWGFYQGKNDSIFIYGKTGLELINKNNRKFDSYQACKEHVYFFLKDYKNDLWIINKGRQNIQRKSADGSSESNYTFDIKRNIHVNSLFEDDSKNVWVCTNNGLFKISNEQAKFASLLGSTDARINNRIPSYRGMCEDKDGSVYIGGYGGLYQLKQGKIRSYLEDSLTYCPYSLIDDGDFLWIATEGNGMMHINKQTGHHQFYHIPEAKNYQFKYRYLVSSLKENDTTIWLADYESIFLFNPKSTLYRSIKLSFNGNDLAQYPVKQFLISSTNHLWIASEIGLIELDEDRKVIHHYNINSSPRLPNNTVNCLLEDSFGNIWLGFKNSGLAKLNPKSKSLELFTENEGLPDNHIATLLLANNGNIWIGTNNGLSEYNIQTTGFSNYFEQDGLADNEFNHGSSLKLSNGDLLFGGVNGLSSIPALAPLTSYETNKLLLSKIEVINADEKIQSFFAFDHTNGITLDYQNRYLNLAFSLSNFQHPDKNVFYYMLEGYDNDWTYLGNKSSLQFASLPFGEYTLKIKGMSASGIWASNSIKIPLKVNQVFYKSFWFLLFLFSSIGGIVWYVINMKMNRLKEIANMRTSISSDLHDDVGSVLTRVAMEAEILQDEVTDEQRNSLHEIAQSCRNAMSNMRDVVWSIDSRNKHVGSLFDKLREHTRNMFEDSHFIYQMELSEKATQLSISPSEKREIYLIYKEAINNILKHSNGNIVHVHVLVVDGYWSLTIFDNGTPFLERSSTGSGTKNMLMRTERIGATLIIDREDGYKVELKMRIKKSYLWQ